MHTSLRAPLCTLLAAPDPERLGPSKLGTGFEPVHRPRCLSPGPGSLLCSHCALIRSRSCVSSIPVPSFSSPPAAVAVANRASQEPTRCSCRARTAWRQPTRGSREEEGVERKADREESERQKKDTQTNETRLNVACFTYVHPKLTTER